MGEEEVKFNVTLWVTMMAQNLGDRWGCVVNAATRTLYLRQRDTSDIVQGFGRAQGQFGLLKISPPSPGS